MILKKDYRDIIDLPHHVSKVHPKMSISDRAAQFSPFAALTGHDEAVKETARLVDDKLDLDEYQKLEINQQLNYLKEHLANKPKAAITYFKRDNKKSGGAYITSSNPIKKVNVYEQYLIFENGIKVFFNDIYKIESIS